MERGRSWGVMHGCTLKGTWLLTLAAALSAQAPKTGVVYDCDENTQIRITRCEKLCDVELGLPGQLKPYMSMSVAGANAFLKSQGCKDAGGKAVGSAVPVRKPSATPAGSTVAAPVCKVDLPAQAPRRGTSTLALSGAGYVYSWSTTNKKTGEVVDSGAERGNFSDTELFLLDDDAERILQRAGVEPGIMGSRIGMLSFFDGGTQVENVPMLNQVAALLGHEGMAQEISKGARDDYECAMRSIRAHSAASVTTDANAQAVFTNLLQGTYYLFGRFYRMRKPVRRGGMYWNLRTEIKPGANRLVLSVSNASEEKEGR